MTTKEDAKKRAVFLKELREDHKETVARTQALLKEQKAVRREICKHIRDEAKDVPTIATLAGMPPSEVLWHITAMKKYGLVVETGMCGEYYLYKHI
jgi:hypothetical protein